jgi:uncharacterized protein YbbK (DUF523 family)
MKILVSACLLGEACRYDGASRPCEHIIKLKEKHTLIPVCPEVMGGLPTPRPASEIQRDGSLVSVEGTDVTEEYRRGAETVLAIAREEWATVAILKEKSPACGKGRVYDGSFTGTLREGNGVCAALLLENGIRVLGESEIDEINAL